MVELDITFVHTTGTVGRTQEVHKEAGKSVKIREATKRRHHAKAGTSGYTSAFGDEAKEQMTMLADEHAAIVPCRGQRLLGTSKLSLALLQWRAVPSCSSHAFASWPERRAKRFKKGQHARMQK